MCIDHSLLGKLRWHMSAGLLLEGALHIFSVHLSILENRQVSGTEV